MAALPSITVLTPVLDEERHLPGVAGRMQAQDYPGEVEFLFIDGGSRDRSRAVLEGLAAQDPRIRLLDNPRRITPAALNVGLAAAHGEVVVRMDAHTHYPPDYLRLGVERLQRGGAVSVSGPQIAVGDGRWSRRVALALSTPLGVGGARFRLRGDAGAEFEVDTGFTGMWWRSTLEAAGGWDEDWTTDQDCELAFRLAADGGRHVCLPAMAAEYIARDSPRGLARQYWRYGYGKVRTWRRHPDAMRTSHVLPPGVALTAIAAVASPRPVRRAARLGVGVYAAALVAGAARARRRAPAEDVAALPAVLATMHLAYGFGALWGFARIGVPTAALAGVARRLARG
jgi:cellulose synthase/poly-beta-1,6-N-acetylglucosamine synthase-like glycosyltransferase